jgi:thiamine transport system permease protein
VDQRLDRPGGALIHLTARSRRAVGLAGLLAAPVAFLLVFFAWPVANIVGEGLRGDHGWELSGVGDVFGDPYLRHVIWFTVWQAAASTVLTVAVALPAAHVLARYEFRGRRLVQAVATVPFVLPTVVVGAAFLALLGPRGPLGVDLDGTVWAILIAHAFFNHAVVVRVVGGLWELLDPTTAEAARVLGASPVRVARSVTLPALRPAIASAALITFLFTFTSFGVVKILGGASHSTLEVEIYRQTASLLNRPVASNLALVQLAAVGTLLVVQGRLARRWAHTGVALRPAARRRPVGGAQRAWLIGNLAFMALLLVTPLAVLVDRSFRTGDGHGLGAWRALAGHSPGSGLFVSPLEAIGNSLRFALVATVVSVVLGGLAAAALVRAGGRVGRALDVGLLLPLGISAVTVGFGFLIALDRPIDLRASPWLVPLAQAVVALPFVVRTMTPVLRSIDGRLREAAAVLGASPARVWREVDLPLVLRAVLVSAGFAFAISLGEFGATTVIARADAPTMPIAIDRLLGRPGALNVGQGFALSTVLMACTAASVLLVDRVRTDRRTPGGWW